MRLRLRLLSLVFVVPMAVWAQTYSVIHLKGKVLNSKTGQPVKVGEKLNKTDKLRFASPDAVLAVISADRGRYTIKPKTAPKPGSEFLALVSESISPFQTSRLSTRGAHDAEGLIDLKSYFGENAPFVILGDSFDVNVNSEAFPMNETSFFVLNYVVDDKEVNKKIGFNGNTLILEKVGLFKVRDEQVSPDEVPQMNLYYYNSATGAKRKITSFSMRFPDEEALKRELQFTLEFINEQDISREEKFLLLYDVVLEFYGKTDQELFARWLRAQQMEY